MSRKKGDAAREGELLPAKRTGPPSLYTPELAAEICRLIADEGRTVRWICKQEGMPAFRTLRDWVRQRPEFGDMYNQALRDRLDFWAEEIIDIADDGSRDYRETQTATGRAITVVDHDHIQRAKLRIESRRFLMAVGNPRRYSERLGTDEPPEREHAMVGSDIERARRLVYILQQARKLAGPDAGSDAA